MTQIDSSSTEDTNIGKAIGFGFAAGFVLVAVPFAITQLVRYADTGTFSPDIFRVYGLSLLLFLPLVQGAVAGYFLGPVYYPRVANDEPLRRRGGAGAAILSLMVLDVAAGMVFLREGVICIIMATPIYIGVIALGILLGRTLTQSRVVQVSLAPLVMLAVVGETLSGQPMYSNAISDAVTINAPPSAVWKYVVSYPENTSPPEYWLWKIGLPVPVQSTVQVQQVGATRLCRFTDGITFEERITELTPDKVLTFVVTKQPDHPEINGHFFLDKGQIYLEANPDGSTTVIATSWYRIFASQGWYFDWWAEDITREIHFRVLGHIKRLAEADVQEEPVL